MKSPEPLVKEYKKHPTLEIIFEMHPYISLPHKTKYYYNFKKANYETINTELKLIN